MACTQIIDHHFPPGHPDREFNMKIWVLWVLGDIPAISSLWNLPGANAYCGCPYCVIHGEYCQRANTVLYSQGRRRLALDHPLRSSFEYEFKEDRPPHAVRTLEETMKNMIAFEEMLEQNHNKTKVKEFIQETGCKGYYSFSLLKKVAAETNIPDVMHLISCWFSKLLKMLKPGDSARGSLKRSVICSSQSLNNT